MGGEETGQRSRRSNSGGGNTANECRSRRSILANECPVQRGTGSDCRVRARFAAGCANRPEQFFAPAVRPVMPVWRIPDTRRRPTRAARPRRCGPLPRRGLLCAPAHQRRAWSLNASDRESGPARCADSARRRSQAFGPSCAAAGVATPRATAGRPIRLDSVSKRADTPSGGALMPMTASHPHCTPSAGKGKQAETRSGIAWACFYLVGRVFLRLAVERRFNWAR